MTMVVNVSNQTRKIGGHTIGPREMADVNMPDKDLRNHLFVRCGDLEVSGGGAPKAKPGPKPKAKSEPAQESQGAESGSTEASDGAE